MVERTTESAISPSTGRTLPDRYIEGTCPICGYPEARGDQCDNCGNQARPHRPDRPAQQDQRGDPGVRPDHPVLPGPARARRRAGGMAGRARGRGHLAAQRHQVLPAHPPGDPAAGDDPGHRLGHPGARLGGPADQAAVRVVRRRRRLPVRLDRVGPAHRRRRGVAAVVERRRGAVLLLHGQGQHRLPLPDLAGRACSGTTARASAAAGPAPTAR